MMSASSIRDAKEKVSATSALRTLSFDFMLAYDIMLERPVLSR